MLVATASALALTVLWLAVMALADTLAGSSSKIVAALRGHSPLAAEQTVAEVRVRVSQRYPSARRPIIVQPELRAAA